MKKFSIICFLYQFLFQKKFSLGRCIYNENHSWPHWKQFLNITVKNKTVIFKTKSNIDYPTYVLDKKNTSLIYIATNILLRYHLFSSENFGVEDIKKNRQRKEISDNDLDSSVFFFQFQYFLFISVSDIKTIIIVSSVLCKFCEITFQNGLKIHW